MSSQRKRIISSCIPCYKRKQKCNRELPCNHCVRRGSVNGCQFYPGALTSPLESPLDIERQEHEQRREDKGKGVLTLDASSRQPPQDYFGQAAQASTVDSLPVPNVPSAALAGCLGYYRHSRANTSALLRDLGLLQLEGESTSLVSHVADKQVELDRIVSQLPERQVLDFLVQHFATEICWLDRVVHLPWFGSTYKIFASTRRLSSVFDVDFAMLVLRVCSFSLQFLPSSTYPLDKIRGMLLTDIRMACDSIADQLDPYSSSGIDTSTSLLYAQQLLFSGLKHQADGKIGRFRDRLGRAIRISQSIGVHGDAPDPPAGMSDLEKTMARQTFATLFVLDSQLSRQLDHVPFISKSLPSGHWLQLQSPEIRNSPEDSTDDEFDYGNPSMLGFSAEKILQVQLADFWRQVGCTQATEFDPMVAEERYERFYKKFLSRLPPTFFLTNPDHSRDRLVRKLPHQRRVLHVSIYDSICWHFRPLLTWKPVGLPSYKCVLVQVQKRRLAAAAVLSLENVNQLHALLGDRHTRLTNIITPTFEAASLLCYLLVDRDFPRPLPTDEQQQPTIDATIASASSGNDPLAPFLSNVTRTTCLRAIQRASNRLKMLAEASGLASLNEEILQQFIHKLPELNKPEPVPSIADSVVQTVEIEQPLATANGHGVVNGHVQRTEVAEQTQMISSPKWHSDWYEFMSSDPEDMTVATSSSLHDLYNQILQDNENLGSGAL